MYTPGPEGFCPVCCRLIPLTETGKLVLHYRYKRYKPSDFHMASSQGPWECPGTERETNPLREDRNLE